MKGIFWNSRGLSDLAKYKYISDTIKDHKLDFVAVMETGNKVCLDRILTVYMGARTSYGTVSPLEGDQEGCYWELIQQHLIYL